MIVKLLAHIHRVCHFLWNDLKGLEGHDVMDLHLNGKKETIEGLGCSCRRMFWVSKRAQKEQGEWKGRFLL